MSETPSTPEPSEAAIRGLRDELHEYSHDLSRLGNALHDRPEAVTFINAPPEVYPAPDGDTPARDSYDWSRVGDLRAVAEKVADLQRLIREVAQSRPAANPAAPAPVTVQFHSLIPTLPVKDIMEAVEFYRDVLGFQVDFTYGEPPGHAGVHKEQACVHFTSSRSTPASGWLYIIVDDVDALHAEYQKRGLKVVEELATYPWGMREFAVKECNGYVLRFGQGVG